MAGYGYSRYQPQSQGSRGYPSYSSRGGQGGRCPSHGHGPRSDFNSQDYSRARGSDSYSGYNNRGYEGFDPRTSYGRSTSVGRQRQGYTDRSGVSYSRDNHLRSGDESHARGQGGGRGGRGPRGQVTPRSQRRGRSQMNPNSDLSTKSKGENDFYSSRDYASTTNQEPPSSYQRGRGRGGGRGRGPRGVRGTGPYRGRGRGRGRGGNFTGGYKRVYPEFKSLVEMANLPEHLSMKELRTSLKEIPLDPKFHIQFLYERKAAIKILEDFNDVVEKLKGIKFGEEEIEISEGKLKPRNISSDGRRKSSSIYIKFVSVVDSKILEESLKKIEFNPRLVLTGGKEPGVTFSTLGCGDVKEARKKVKALKIPGFEVGGVKIVGRKQPMLIVKLAPKTGNLKLENLPKDCDPKKLKIKLKQKLSYDIVVGKIEDGNVDVRYSPKTMVVLEKLAGLEIGENEVKVKEVDDGEDDHQELPKDDQLKFALPKDLTKENFDKILGKCLPNEIRLGKESFTLKFIVPSKVIKNVKKFVLAASTDEIVSIINKNQDKSLEDTNILEDEAHGGKREVKAVFGSTDIRYREEKKALSQDGSGGEKMRPTGEIN